MKVAFQISGDLRNWETAYVLFSQYKIILEDKGFEVNFFIHTWDKPYTHQCIEAGLFDIFNAYEVTPLPQEGISEVNGKTKSLYSWSYSMFRSSMVRRDYQYKNKIEYQKVLSTRPDIYVPYDYWGYMDEKVGKESSYMLNYPPFRKSGRSTDKWPHVVSDDLKIVGTQEAIDLFSLNFHLMYIDDDPSFIGTYHSVPGLTIMKYGLTIESKSGLAGKWMILRRNDGKTIMQDGENRSKVIEQVYLNDGMMEKVLKRVGILT